MTEQEPNVRIVVEAQRQFGWGSQVGFRYWVEGTERPPLSDFQAGHLVAVLRHVATLIDERRCEPEKSEGAIAYRAMRAAERSARLARAEYEGIVLETVGRRGLHAAASEHGLPETMIRGMLRRQTVRVA